MTFKTSRLTRRHALLTGAGALFGATFLSNTSYHAKAAAPQLGPARPTHYRFKLGDFELTTLSDGNVKADGLYPTFGENMKAEEVEALAHENFLPLQPAEFGFTPLIVNTGKEIILFDTGNGEGQREKGIGRLAVTLAQAGFQPEQIDVVVITHCHPDHIGGVMEDGKPLFPKARYVIGEEEYKFWSPKEKAEGATAQVGKLVQTNIVPLAEKMTFLKPEGEVVPGIRAVKAFGHTPGHMAFHIESGNKRLLLWGDLTNHYVVSLQRPDWHVKFDMDKEAAAATRKRILDMAATDRIPVSGYHMPFPSVGFVEKKDSGYRYIPASYQLNL